MAFKASPSSQHQHFTDEAQKAAKSLQLTRLFVGCLPEDFLREAFVDLGEIKLSSICFSLCCPSGLLFYFFGGVFLRWPMELELYPRCVTRLYHVI